VGWPEVAGVATKRAQRRCDSGESDRAERTSGELERIGRTKII
jgi:hypothetical protein